jgi:hypothetical protein
LHHLNNLPFDSSQHSYYALDKGEW